MRRVLTPDQMRALEARHMLCAGIPSLDLMERAAQGVARAALEAARGAGRTAVFACGRGGNGGDGYAAARLYARAGGRALVLPVAGIPEAGDARVNYDRALLEPDVALLHADALEQLAAPAVWVDAMFGIGLARPMQGDCALVAARMEADRARGAHVLSVDVPSGLDALNGKPLGACVRATETITFQCPKAGHLLGSGPDLTGVLRVWPLSIPEAALPPDALYQVTRDDALSALPPRPRDSHKGVFGHLLLIAGSRGMAGAAALAALSALKSGAGLVTVACPESILPIVQILAPCATALALPEADGALSSSAVPAIERALAGKRAVAIGPGLSTKAHPDVVRAVLKSALPAVLDADALNLMAENRELCALLSSRHLLTPHPGEAARLLDAQAQNPLPSAWALGQWGAAVLYKGASTIVAGGRTYIHCGGCPGLAKGGSGDVLTGMLGALIARGMQCEDAAWAGAALHGALGVATARRLGHTAMTARDLIDDMGTVWGDVEPS